MEITLGAPDQLRIGASVTGWSLSELSPGAGYEGALVVAGGALPVICYGWQPDAE